MKTVIIKNNWFTESDLRLDASFHLSEGHLTLVTFQNAAIKTKPLAQITEKIFYGNRSKRVYVNNPKKGLPFIKGADITKANFSSLKYISKARTANLENYFLEEGWTLITRSGTIGNTAYVNKDFIGKAASDDIIRVVPKNIPSGFLYAFLSSKYGQNLLKHGTYGAVIQHIEPEHIENIPIPIFPPQKQKEIHNLIVEAADLRVEANRLLEDSVTYFNNLYSAKTNKITKIFTRNVKDLSFSWAAYNNNKEVSEITNKFDENYLKIGEVSESIFAPPMFKHIYLEKDNGNPFLTGSELTRQNPKYYRWLSPKGVKDIQTYKVEKNTLLLYKSGTTDGGILGNVFIADDNLNGVCLSDHVIRIRISDINLSYWIYAFLKSEAGVKLLQSIATGTMIPFITPERLSVLTVPKPDENFQTICDNISAYLYKRVEANNKESQAIHLIEKEIDSWQQS